MSRAHELALQEVSKRLAFNVAAYGVAWNGEHEDTEFVCQPITDESERLRAALRNLLALAEDHSLDAAARDDEFPVIVAARSALKASA